MRNGGELRGNSYDRRRRRAKILRDPDGKWHGNGSSVRCVHCGIRVTNETLEVDQIIPGDGYAWANVQPSCRPCNKTRSFSRTWRAPIAKRIRARAKRMGGGRLRREADLARAA